MENKYEYTGTWIPAQIMECEELSYSEKFLYAEIASYKQCFVSNAFLAKRMGSSERQVQRWLATLVEHGFITKAFSGRQRYLQARQKRHPSHDKSDTPATTKSTPIDNNIDNSIDITNVIGSEAETHGKSEINNLFDYWQDSTGIPINSRVQKNRYAANNLIKKHGINGVERLIDGVAQAQGDQYAPSISDFTDLQLKLNQLLVWGKRRSNKGVEVIS